MPMKRAGRWCAWPRKAGTKRVSPTVSNSHALMSIAFSMPLTNRVSRGWKITEHGLLEQQRDEPLPSERTVGRAMAVNRQFHGAPGPWKSARDEQPAPVSYAHLPYRPKYPHHMWFTDIRYLVQLNGSWVYSICVMEGYSRKILAGMVSPHQDLTAVLQILFAALSTYACPQAVISDNGSV